MLLFFKVLMGILFIDNIVRVFLSIIEGFFGFGKGL